MTTDTPGMPDPIEKLKSDNEFMKNVLRDVMGEGPFICGKAGKDQESPCSEVLFVCPAYGAAFRSTTAYWRDDKYKALQAENERLKAAVRDLAAVLGLYAREISYGNAPDCLQRNAATIKEANNG